MPGLWQKLLKLNRTIANYWDHLACTADKTLIHHMYGSTKKQKDLMRLWGDPAWENPFPWVIELIIIVIPIKINCVFQKTFPVNINLWTVLDIG